ncbi:MAG: PEGA domain-containing protein, partial [Ignavibacteria bacterium]
NIFGIEKPLLQSKEEKKKILNKTVLKISILSFAVILLVVLVFNYNTQEKNSEVTNNVSINPTDSTKLLTNTNPPQVKTDKIKSEQIKNPISDLNTTAQQKLPETTENLNTREGKLMIACYPWAEVYIDDHKFETTPLNAPINLKTGLHKIRLIHPNFPPIEKTIEITADKQYIMDINFYKYFGFVQFKIIPWGEIIINNKKFGITPFEKPVILNPGKYVLNISNPNFGSYIDTILIQSGETLFYKLNLNSITHWHNN